MPQIITPPPKAPDAGIGLSLWRDGFWDGETVCRDRGVGEGVE
jgi:hypothetical protein